MKEILTKQKTAIWLDGLVTACGSIWKKKLKKQQRLHTVWHFFMYPTVIFCQREE